VTEIILTLIARANLLEASLRGRPDPQHSFSPLHFSLSTPGTAPVRRLTGDDTSRTNNWRSYTCGACPASPSCLVSPSRHAPGTQLPAALLHPLKAFLGAGGQQDRGSPYLNIGLDGCCVDTLPPSRACGQSPWFAFYRLLKVAQIVQLGILRLTLLWPTFTLVDWVVSDCAFVPPTFILI